MDPLSTLMDKVKSQSHNINIIAGVFKVDPSFIHRAIDTAVQDARIVDTKITELIEELRSQH